MRSPGNDTIAAIATAPGAGGIGIVRISGPGALPVADRIFRDRGGRPLAAAPPFQLVLGTAGDPESRTAIDEVLAVHMPAGRSYTGEVSVELQAHGGPFILESLLQAAVRGGARHAGPGEFTRRAFLSGRIDLAQAEAVCALIGAEDVEARCAALLQLGGAVAETLRPLRERLLDFLARTEAALDLEEEEAPAEIPTAREVRDLAATLRRSGGGGVDEIRAFRGVRVALCGRPNAGKSSIFNYLLDCDRSIVSSIPGTTRDYVEERSVLGGASVTLVDTAGFCETCDAVEAEGVRRSTRQIAEADVAVLVIDGSEANHFDDIRLLELTSFSSPLIVVGKSDLRQRFDAGRLNAEASGLRVFRTSVRTGEGFPEFIAELGARCQTAAAGRSTPIARLNARHREALNRSAGFLEAAAGLSEEHSGSLDVIAIELRAALDSLGEITGETATEEILDRIFSRFCVGK